MFSKQSYHVPIHVTIWLDVLFDHTLLLAREHGFNLDSFDFFFVFYIYTRSDVDRLHLQASLFEKKLNKRIIVST